MVQVWWAQVRRHLAVGIVILHIIACRFIEVSSAVASAHLVASDPGGVLS